LKCADYIDELRDTCSTVKVVTLRWLHEAGVEWTYARSLGGWRNS